jgi:hypothetical protein
MGYAGAIIFAEGDSFGLHVAPSAAELGSTVAKALEKVA